MQCAVSLEPAPAMIGHLPAATSFAKRTHSTCTSSDIVDASPVVPQMISASIPFVIWNSISSFILGKFTLPSAFMGVTRAVPAPVKIDISKTSSNYVSVVFIVYAFIALMIVSAI